MSMFHPVLHASIPERAVVSTTLACFATTHSFLIGRDNVVLRLCKGSGLGLFAKTSVPTGQFICLYAGEFIDQTQAQQRFAKQESEGQGNYILCMRENGAVIGFVDPTFKGNIGYGGRSTWLFRAHLT